MEESSAEERIRIRAYELYLARGEQPGRHEDDWLQAEREISTLEAESEPGTDDGASDDARNNPGPSEPATIRTQNGAIAGNRGRREPARRVRS